MSAPVKPDPYTAHADLRAYLKQIGAPADAMEHIMKVLGWRPPSIWEAPRAQADAINAAVEELPGMRHVGWFCEHPWSSEPPYERLTRHRKVNRKNKRGWTEEKNVGKSLSFGDYDMEIACPQRVPMYIRTTEQP